MSLVRSMGLVLSHSVSEWATFANLTDVTLADEDTNPILTDIANRAIQGNVAMHVTLPGGQLWKQCKWCHLVAKFATNSSDAIWWLDGWLHYMLAKFLTNASGILFCWRDNSSFRCCTLGPLCLWQCFLNPLLFRSQYYEGSCYYYTVVLCALFNHQNVNWNCH